MTGELTETIVVPGYNVRDSPECADHLLLAMIMETGRDPTAESRPKPECADQLLLAMIVDLGRSLFLTDADLEGRK